MVFKFIALATEKFRVVFGDSHLTLLTIYSHLTSYKDFLTLLDSLAYGHVHKTLRKNSHSEKLLILTFGYISFKCGHTNLKLQGR